MSFDAISEQRLALVHPVLSQRMHNLELVLEGEWNIQIRITQGLRTWAEQNALYAQGRTAPGKIVTNAKGGYSAHNMGYACDFCCMNGALPDWNARDSQWLNVLNLATQFKLAEGATWRTFPDEPHLYLAELSADPDDEMRYIMQEQGISALWRTWNLS